MGNVTLRAAAEQIVRQLLARANADWRLWASLSGYLPLLAEAGPDAFLAAVESGLGGNKVILELFREEPHPLFGLSQHTGLLWALETLAWSPDYIGRAALILAKLARLDPGGKLANRPDGSLRAIFLPWLPQTAATVEERLRVLDVLRNREPDAAWKLMRQCLPENHSFGHPSHKPSWRDWAPDAQKGATNREYFTMTKEILGRLLSDVGTNGSRWSDLIDSLGALPPDQYGIVVERLLALDATVLPVDDRALIWNAIRKLLSHHRSFPDAEWALPAERLAPLSATYERLLPDESIARYGWLFSDRVDLPEGREKDWEAKEKAVHAGRVDAVRAVYTQSGLQGVLEFIPKIDRPLSLGFTLASVELISSDEDAILHEYLAAPDEGAAEFARGVVVGRVQERGVGWAEAKIMHSGQGWSVRQRGEFLGCLPNTQADWDLVERTDAATQREYWRVMRRWGVQSQDVEYVVRKLLEYGRPFTAIDLLSIPASRKGNIPPTLIIEALELAVRTDPKTDENVHSFSYNVARLLDALEQTDGVDLNRIAWLEWAYLPLLRLERGPKLLRRELVRNPEFFMQILSLVFRAEREKPHETSEQERAQAQHGHDLLESCRTVPGTTEVGEIRADELIDWLRRARELAQANGRGTIADLMIGKILSGSPPGKDGAWPAEPVRDVIEIVTSEDLEEGFQVGHYNSRGVVTRNPAEGGEQERQLAKRYEKYADAVRDRWPRTAAVLRNIAENYRAQARREDDQFELLGQLDR